MVPCRPNMFLGVVKQCRAEDEARGWRRQEKSALARHLGRPGLLQLLWAALPSPGRGHLPWHAQQALLLLLPPLLTCAARRSRILLARCICVGRARQPGHAQEVAPFGVSKLARLSFLTGPCQPDGALHAAEEPCGVRTRPRLPRSHWPRRWAAAAAPAAPSCMSLPRGMPGRRILQECQSKEAAAREPKAAPQKQGT